MHWLQILKIAAIPSFKEQNKQTEVGQRQQGYMQLYEALLCDRQGGNCRAKQPSSNLMAVAKVVTTADRIKKKNIYCQPAQGLRV